MNRATIELPEDVSATLSNFDLTVEGPNGSVTRRLWYPDVTVRVDRVESTTGDGEVVEVDAIVVESDADDAKTAATVGTFESHVSNMIHGVTDGWEYRMEAFYSHFPMQVGVEGDEVVISNFLGERSPRRTEIRGDTEVEVDGEEIVLRGPSIEDVGQTAADVEQLNRIKDKDNRVFQDGVYITNKPTRGEVP